ncbi:hypothetical protein EHQ16_19380 [Leptospira kanakyensis]|uniref:Uncharacterized protein n=1 Tax=Leptospira kanakyensis TaxID=2484968 RepID=A0A6N4Q6F7_9LEPT|nr:hypothetical protein [Leptospira kanakyensis]TGK51146.1 hypothetical protein EHQ11_09110 [Leptospira kanakyensis]TGK56372.1 hypothetical protein EHQ16_19380 [Leptospira kanakyensis]TGK65690.1 hypothetical protein EHQ18_19165 [Leptospira kanakyensis]
MKIFSISTVYLITILILHNCIILTTTNVKNWSSEKEHALGNKILFNKDTNKFETTPNFQGKIIYLGDILVTKRNNQISTLEIICFSDTENSKEYLKATYYYRVFREKDKLCIEKAN